MDTAQAFAPAETVDAQIDNAADAFKAFTTGQPVMDRPRDEHGRFASADTEEDTAEAVADEGEPEAVEADADEEEQAADPAQPMPTSWPADKAAEWASLPAETQGFLAEREAERDRAVNAKFQESANVRKAAEAEREQAASSRKEYAEGLERLKALINPVEPDPRAYGAGTGQYNREAYDLALVQYREQQGALSNIDAQLAEIKQQAADDEAKAFKAWKDEHEREYAPKFVADVPDLTDPAKGDAILRGLVDFAIERGIPAENFAPEEQESITSAQLHLVWKAMQFDQLRAKGAEAPAKPKPANPAIRPGVSSPRSAQRHAQVQRDRERLNREGSVEAGAAMFKHFLKG